jgi:hypothetical protein
MNPTALSISLWTEWGRCIPIHVMGYWTYVEAGGPSMVVDSIREAHARAKR